MNFGSGLSGDTVSVVSTERQEVTGLIGVGFDPRAIVFHPSGAFAYVTNNGGGVSVIDTMEQRMVATIPVRTAPYGLAVHPGGQLLYVANSAPVSNSVSVVHTATRETLATIPVPLRPDGVAITADGRFVYVTSRDANVVSVIDTILQRVVTGIPLEASPRAFGQFIGLTIPHCSGFGSRMILGRIPGIDNSAGIPNVTVRAHGPNGCMESVKTNGNGMLMLRRLRTGSYTVAPSRSGCSFDPPVADLALFQPLTLAFFRGECP